MLIYRPSVSFFIFNVFERMQIGTTVNNKLV